MENIYWTNLPETSAVITILRARLRQVIAVGLVSSIVAILVAIAPEVAQNALVIATFSKSFRTRDLRVGKTEA